VVVVGAAIAFGATLASVVHSSSRGFGLGLGSERGELCGGRGEGNECSDLDIVPCCHGCCKRGEGYAVVKPEVAAVEGDEALSIEGAGAGGSIGVLV
jgi:hypothetical protein